MGRKAASWIPSTRLDIQAPCVWFLVCSGFGRAVSSPIECCWTEHLGCSSGFRVEALNNGGFEGVRVATCVNLVPKVFCSFKSQAANPQKIRVFHRYGKSHMWYPDTTFGYP